MINLIKRKITPMLLIIVLLIGVLPFIESAGKTYATTDQIVYIDNIDEAGTALRAEMVKRNASPVIYYKAEATYDQKKIAGFASDIFANALMHTGNPKEGDYLECAWKNRSSHISYSVKGDYVYIKIAYNIKYYTNATQEAELDKEIKKLKTKLNLDNKSDYQIVNSIYNYICSNIDYDYEHKNDKSYGLQYTAYAGLVNKTCVCQGYAALFYRLASEYDIDTRVITGVAGGQEHAWNIVKLNGKYYCLDATWDSNRSTHEYFLRGSKNWSTHVAKDKFNTSEFKSKYPISSADYISLKAPKISLTTVASSGNPKLTWGKVTGATKYEVWRKAGSNGTYKKYHTTTGTSMTNTSTKAGIIYYYKVRAIYSCGSHIVYSNFSDIKSIACDLPQPTTKLTTVASTGKPKLTWESITDASKYEVWRKSGSKGTYKKYYTTTNTSMTNTSAKAGTTYYYKVKAICERNSGGNSAFSSEQYITCDLAKPTLKSSLNNSGKPKLTWGKVTGATKYEVWRKVGSNGTYKKYYTTSKTSFTNTSAKKGTTYYYKVKAIYGGNSYANSAYSNIVSRTSK